MADKSFGVKELNLLNASGTPTVTSPNNLNLNANTVAISTSCTIGSNLDVDGTTNLDNTDIVGVTTIRNVGGVKLYEGSGNGSKLFHAGTERLSTELYGIDINGTLGADSINCSGIITGASFSGDGSALSNLPASAPVGGASTNTVFFENDIAVAVNYQITTNKNAMSAGPITINAGIAVTVPSGSAWTIV